VAARIAALLLAQEANFLCIGASRRLWATL